MAFPFPRHRVTNQDERLADSSGHQGNQESLLHFGSLSKRQRIGAHTLIPVGCRTTTNATDPLLTVRIQKYVWHGDRKYWCQRSDSCTVLDLFEAEQTDWSIAVAIEAATQCRLTVGQSFIQVLENPRIKVTKNQHRHDRKRKNAYNETDYHEHCHHGFALNQTCIGQCHAARNVTGSSKPKSA